MEREGSRPARYRHGARARQRATGAATMAGHGPRRQVAVRHAGDADLHLRDRPSELGSAHGGRRYRIETSGRQPDHLAESALLLDESAFPSQPFTGAIGYAGLLPDADRNASAVMVAFGTTKAPPARDAIVTLVAADSSMRATSARFACAEHDDHDNDVAVHLEPIR